jgi:hypothetical protein
VEGLPTIQEQLGKKQIAVRQDAFEVSHWPGTSMFKVDPIVKTIFRPQ